MKKGDAGVVYFYNNTICNMNMNVASKHKYRYLTYNNDIGVI